MFIGVRGQEVKAGGKKKWISEFTSFVPQDETVMDGNSICFVQ